MKLYLCPSSWRCVDTTKFFGCELGSQTTIDDKIERYIVNGEHTAARFQDLLDLFIQKYVLCANCGNPETNMVRKLRSFSVYLSFYLSIYLSISISIFLPLPSLFFPLLSHFIFSLFCRAKKNISLCSHLVLVPFSIVLHSDVACYRST